MITGPAALALHGFAAAPPLPSLDRIDVLVPRTRRLRSVGCARIVRAAALPEAERVSGVPVAPVARALADAVAESADAGLVRELLTEAVRGGHCEPASVVEELIRARLLSRPHVVDAVESLVAEGRALAEDRLYRMVREHALPDPVWNVDLRLPGGPHLGGVDAYWPDHAVAVELDTGAHRQRDDALGPEHARKREHLERLGITVVHLTPRKLRDHPDQQAVIVRTALMAAADRAPAAYVVVLPR
jgi:very-short-patch-repair endonuclease